MNISNTMTRYAYASFPHHYDNVNIASLLTPETSSDSTTTAHPNTPGTPTPPSTPSYAGGSSVMNSPMTPRSTPQRYSTNPGINRALVTSPPVTPIVHWRAPSPFNQSPAPTPNSVQSTPPGFSPIPASFVRIPLLWDDPANRVYRPGIAFHLVSGYNFAPLYGPPQPPDLSPGQEVDFERDRGQRIWHHVRRQMSLYHDWVRFNIWRYDNRAAAIARMEENERRIEEILAARAEGRETPVYGTPAAASPEALAVTSPPATPQAAPLPVPATAFVEPWTPSPSPSPSPPSTPTPAPAPVANPAVTVPTTANVEAPQATKKSRKSTAKTASTQRRRTSKRVTKSMPAKAKRRHTTKKSKKSTLKLEMESLAELGGAGNTITSSLRKRKRDDTDESDEEGASGAKSSTHYRRTRAATARAKAARGEWAGRLRPRTAKKKNE